jgi:hypothetical protein
METGSTLGALTRPVIGVHSGRPVWPDPNPKRHITIEFRIVSCRPMGLALGPTCCW